MLSNFVPGSQAIHPEFIVGVDHGGREPKDEAVVVALVEVGVRGDDLYGGWVVVQLLPI